MEINYYLVIIVVVLISISTACLSNPNEKISLSEAESLIGLKPLEEITNDEVWSMIGAQVYSYRDYVSSFGSSYLIKDKKVTQLGFGFGGYSISSMCIADLNKNQKPELIYFCNFGSGINYTIPGCYEDGRRLEVSFYSTIPHMVRLIKKDLNKVKVVTLSKQKEIDVGELYLDSNILKINLFNGISEDIKKNLIEKYIPL